MRGWRPSLLDDAGKIVRTVADIAFNASRTSVRVFLIQKNNTHLRQLLVESIGDSDAPVAIPTLERIWPKWVARKNSKESLGVVPGFPGRC